MALVLLILVFRSILVPVVGVLGFLLTIGSSLDATVAVFQWGWLKALVQADSTGPLLSLTPILVIGVLFGLAMDYQVFLVSRIHEAHAHGTAPVEAIRTGFRQAAPRPAGCRAGSPGSRSWTYRAWPWSASRRKGRRSQPADDVRAGARGAVGGHGRGAVLGPAPGRGGAGGPGIEVVAPDRVVRVRGLSDTELAGLRMPVAVIPSLGGPFHQRRTVDALLALIPGATERPGAPESPRPDFPPHLDAFVAALATF